MLEYLRSLIVERRKVTRREECDGCDYDRRRMTRKQADEKLSHAIDKFSETVTLSPARVQELLEKAKR